MSPSYNHICEHYRELALLDGIEALLGWDERTMLPPAGGPHRADQMALLAGLIHRRRTDPRIGDALAALADSPLAADRHSDVGATIAELRREHDKQSRIPPTLVESLTRATVVGQQVWVQARKADDFRQFAPQLSEIVRLLRDKARCVGLGDCLYDALLDDYEPGARTAELKPVLSQLGARLAPLVSQIVDSGRQAPRGILQRPFPVDAQRSFGRHVAQQLGFDFDAGRLDETAHPFCTTLGPRDCRITTRYDKHSFSSAFFGTLHEAGHGIYEQGLRATHYGLPPGQAASLGVHESQSRLWENLVGRSLEFWEHFFPQAQQQFPGFKDVPLRDFYWAINDVRPSLIRVEADEATYNLHILIRLDLEQDLIDDRLAIDDLPQAWNDQYAHYLGMTAPSAADGVLQDIHWSAGLIGYFATYALGNLYAAQLFQRACDDLEGLRQQFREGDFSGLLAWLRKNVHAAGRTRPAPRLMADVSGAPLSCSPLMSYLESKLLPLYS